MARFLRVAVLAVTTVLLASGCSSTVGGSGAATSPASGGSAARTPASPAKSGASGASGSYPRQPFSSAVGDPATADVCAAIPLRSFAVLRGYTAGHDGEVVPPGCSVRIGRHGRPAFSVVAYGIASDSFSHLGPPHVSKVVRTGRIDGVTVNYYAFAATPIGDCARDVIAEGITFKVDVLGSADDGSSARVRTLHCAAADAMTKDLAVAVASRHFPRLELASPSLTRLDFCAALRATGFEKVSDFTGTAAVDDGVGDGCQLTRGSSLSLYLDFEVEPTAVPPMATAISVGGHHLYAGTANDRTSFCAFTSVQGRTSDGRFEIVSATSNNVASGSALPAPLCTQTETLLGHFLDTAGLT